MCGVARQPGNNGELVVAPLQTSNMPPSITVGSDPNKGCSPPSGDAPRQPPRNSPSGNENVPTIDLAGEADGDDDLQKAIELSLQDQQQEIPAVPGVSAEDQEVSRALEASLKESRPKATIDNINPLDRKRISKTPVGLKNIGNSCWFNVVIQPLLHIPSFRDLILNYKCPNDFIESENSKEIPPNVVQLLRKLFALLIASEKKYVDPTTVVNVFQGHEMRKDTQQDVCEFIHKLLEKLEIQFQKLLSHQGIEKESSGHQTSKDADFDNPITQLFYGQSRNEKCDEDGSKHITFGQYLLHVMNYKNIHESILASMSKNIPDITQDTVRPVQQETWFKILPPVLIFSLSRYEYSKEKKRTEKVHNKFEFPQYLHMDRYMEINKKFIKEKHIKVARLREDLNALNRTLDKYLKFGSGSGKYPLSDILKYALEFAQSNAETKSDGVADAVPSPSKMEVDSVEMCESTDVEMSEEPETKGAIENREKNEEKKQETESESDANTAEECSIRIPSPSKKMRIMPPTPSCMNANELSVLQSCLPRWQHEVEQQVEELQRGISSLEEQLDKIYDDPFLTRIPYKLHAVVVHEGQASGGHYWVYIHNPASDAWMKFNDVQVCESKWEEVLQDSIGGQNNASAYCLMYIDESRFDKLFPNPSQSIENVISDMPLDLQEYVKSDNIEFRREMKEWEEKLRRRQASATGIDSGSNDGVPATAPNSPRVVHVEEEDVGFFLEVETMISHSANNLLNKAHDQSADIFLKVFLNNELTRQRSFAEQKMDIDSFSGDSLLDLGVYMLKNGQNNDTLVKWYCCEVIWQKTLQCEKTPKVEQISQETKCLLTDFHNQYSKSMGSIYKDWKANYRSLIECAWYFVYGFQQFNKGNYECGINLLNAAVQLNNQLETTEPLGPHKTLDKRVLRKCRRFCLLEFNSKLIQLFMAVKTEEQAVQVTEAVFNSLVPGISCLLETRYEDDRDDSIAVAIIGESWCRFLEPNVETKGYARTKIKKILEGVLDGEREKKTKLGPISVPSLPVVLCLYKQFIDTCRAVMAIPEKKMQTSDL